MTTALYRRYRPESFADVIGQEHVTEPLMQALRTGRVNHAYLFSGPRGCGKTTSARILARCLNCEQGPTPTPCGQCESCVALARGGSGSVDVIEIDAASHGGVEDARDLRERALFGPANSRFKIYIIDEAHMVTPQGFNALLKIVEEPPEHVKFVFATTEPEKVIGTIRSRTHHYPFRLVPPKKLTDYMEKLLAAENVPCEPGVLSFVTRAGGGSVRDSLSVLDQLIAGSGPEGLTYSSASALLGFTDDELLDSMVEAFAAADSAAVFRQIDKVVESGSDPRRFVEDLLERLRDLIVVAAVAEGAGAVLRSVPEDQLERMRQQAASFGPGALSRAADVMNAGLTAMSGATSPRLQLELMCARVLLPGIAGLDGYAARLDRMERRLDMGQLPPSAPAEAPRHAPSMPPMEASSPSGAQPSRAQAAAPQTQSGASTGSAERSPRPESVEHSSSLGSQQPSETDPQGHDTARQEAPSPNAQTPQGASHSQTAAPGHDVARPQSQAQPRSTQSEHASAEGSVSPSGQGAHPQSVNLPGSQSAGTQLPGAHSQAGQPSPASGARHGGLSTDDVRRAWPDVLDRVFRIKRVTWTLLSQNAQVLEFDGQRLVLGANSPGLAQTMSRGQHPEVVRQALIEAIGVDVTVEARPMPVGQSAPSSQQEPQQQPGAGTSGAGVWRAPQWDEPAPEGEYPPDPRHFAGPDAESNTWQTNSQAVSDHTSGTDDVGRVASTRNTTARSHEQPHSQHQPPNAEQRHQAEQRPAGGAGGGWRARTGWNDPSGPQATGPGSVAGHIAGSGGNPGSAGSASSDVGLAMAAANSSAWGSHEGDWGSMTGPAPDWARTDGEVPRTEADSQTGGHGDCGSAAATDLPEAESHGTAGTATTNSSAPDAAESETPAWMEDEPETDVEAVYDPLPPRVGRESVGSATDYASGASVPVGPASSTPPSQADDDRQLTPRQRAEKAAREAAQRAEDQKIATGGSQYDDQNVSLDDEDIENFDAVGLPVIKAVLGGTVIKEEGPEAGA